MAIDRRRLQQIMFAGLYADDGGGGGTPAPATSSITLRSTGNVNAPVPGDLLYVETSYVSEGTSLQDYSATSYTWKRDGSPITLDSTATQYMVTAADNGAVISVDVDIVEQDTTAQSTLTASCGGASIGTTWKIGEIQTNFKALYDCTDNTFPKLQLYDDSDTTSIARIKSVLGNNIDLKPEQNGQIINYNALGFVSGDANRRNSWLKGIEGFDGSNVTIFFRFKVPDPFDNQVYLLRYFGVTNRQLLMDTIPGRYRVDLNGLRTANDSILPGDEITLIIRMSDTPFTTINAVPNRYTEIYMRQDDGITVTEHFVNNQFVNYWTGSSWDIGHGSTTTGKFWPEELEIKAWGISDTLISDTVMNDMITNLPNL